MIDVKPPFSRVDRMLNVALWVNQMLVLTAFGIAAWMKIELPIAKLVGIWPWTGDLAPVEVRALGVIDLLGGLGLVLPMLTRIRPWLTIFAAIGDVALQICAVTFHTFRGEIADTPVNIILIAMLAFILWGRTKSQARIWGENHRLSAVSACP